MLSKIAIYTATGGVENSFGAGSPHRFNYIIGEYCPLIEIDFRLASSSRDIRIGRQVNYDIVPFHGGAELIEVANITANEMKARIANVILVVPFTPRGEIVVQRYGLYIT